jgi:acyl-CoA synthetase (AMP-forming)/AMP-acid ligase II
MLATRRSPDALARHAELTPAATAIVDGDERVSWRELAARRDRLASALHHLGVRGGDRVVVYLPSSIDAVVAPAAIAAIGATAIPMNHRLVADEVRHILEHSEAVAVLVADDFLPVVESVRASIPTVKHWVLVGQERRPWALDADQLLAGAPPGLPEDAAPRPARSMVYTSGTLGRPKGAIREHLDPTPLMSLFGLAGRHVHLVAGPLHHSAPGGLAQFSLQFGSTLVILRKFDPEAALAAIERHRCTSTFMAPTLVQRILDLPPAVRARHDVSSLRVLLVAGSPCPMRVKEEALAFFGPVLWEFYGSTELGINTILAPEDMLRRPGSSGRPAPGSEIAILDESGNPVPRGTPGELFVRRRPAMFQGYFKDEPATAAARRGEWVSVGDVAWMDEDDHVFICDRKHDLIISGGVNIYPAEIEDVLHRLPEVRDVAVFGVPDAAWGERVHAAIQPSPGADCRAEDVVGFARRHLADFKVPRDISFHDDFPRDAAGKVLKRVLRERAASTGGPGTAR